MFDNSNVIVGLEIGTSKICCIVGELHPDTGALNIVAVGRAKSRGVRKGEIVDAAVAEEDVRAAIVEAEDMSNSEINSVYLGVSGAHIRGTTNRGVHPIVSHDRAITEDDVDDVVKNSKVVNLPPGDLLSWTVSVELRIPKGCTARGWSWICTSCTATSTACKPLCAS
jgi:cell division protein FtsA